MNYLKILPLLLLFLNCVKQDPCDGYLCFTPPEPITFQCVDMDTGEDLFYSGALDSSMISITMDDSEAIDFEFVSYQNACFIYASDLGWNTGKHTYEISINSYSIPFTLHTEETNKDCCSYFETVSFDLTKYPYEKIDSTGVYQIQMDL